MNGMISKSRYQALRWGVLGLVALLTLAVLGAGNVGAAPPAPGGPTVPLVQQFEDVPDSHPFSTFINNLYLDAIISGYTCGGPGEPCGAGNLPYYRPNSNVTRAQMAKFVENGRRNIDDAIGQRLIMTNPLQAALVISSTTTDSIDVSNASGAEAIQALCTRASQNCWAFYAGVEDGDRPAYLDGGRGSYSSSSDLGYAGLEAYASADTSYGGELRSNIYRGGYVKSNNNGRFSLFVDTQDGPTQATAGLDVNGTVRIEGNLVVVGSKTGYVVDIMQNVDGTALEAGDVVTIVGNSAAVLGDIPVITVQKATGAYDTGVVGIVDQIVYVPDAATKAAYEAQERAIRDALDRRAAADSKGQAGKGEGAEIVIPAASITDEQGTVHVLPNATQAATNDYVNVVTLGSYKAVKVDASFGPIRAGDLLTTSPHAGYAMKANDAQVKMGSVIGKALGTLATGTGTVPVMVTLK